MQAHNLRASHSTSNNLIHCPRSCRSIKCRRNCRRRHAQSRLPFARLAVAAMHTRPSTLTCTVAGTNANRPSSCWPKASHTMSNRRRCSTQSSSYCCKAAAYQWNGARPALRRPQALCHRRTPSRTNAPTRWIVAGQTRPIPSCFKWSCAVWSTARRRHQRKPHSMCTHRAQMVDRRVAITESLVSVWRIRNLSRQNNFGNRHHPDTIHKRWVSFIWTSLLSTAIRWYSYAHFVCATALNTRLERQWKRCNVPERVPVATIVAIAQYHAWRWRRRWPVHILYGHTCHSGGLSADKSAGRVRWIQ